MSWLIRCILSWAAMLAASTCCYLARSTRPGLQRFLVVLPALAVIHLTPLLFNPELEPLSAMSSAFLCVRLTAGKVAAFILGRGALTLPLSLVQFTAVMLAPFMPAEIAADKVATTPSGAPPGSEGGSPFKLAGLPHLQTVWQRVSAVQRFSIDSSRSSSSSSMCSSGSGSSQSLSASTPTPLDSPRIAAVRQQQGANSPAASGSSSPRPGTPTSEQQSATTAAVAAAPAATDATAAPAKVLRATFKPSRLAAATAAVSSSGNRRFSSPSWQQAANLVLNVAVALAFLVYSCHSWAAARAVASQLTALWVMWRAMEALMWCVSHPARTHLGMTLAPHFVNPFASTSLTDFWARRWNITQGLVLRFYVYEPIIQGCLVAPQAPHTAPDQPSNSSSGHSPHGTSALKHRNKPVPLSGSAGDGQAAAAPSAAAAVDGRSAAVAPRWRRQVAAAATFLVSGLEHELFLWYLLRTWGLTWFCFFAAQGALLAVEGKVKRSCRAAGLQLHPFVSHLAVLLALGVTADAFFWPPLMQPGLVQPLRAALATTPLAPWLGVAA